MLTDNEYEDGVTLVDSNSLSKKTTQDNHLFDGQKHLKKYTWTYYSMHNMDICVKHVKFSSLTNLVHLVAEEELGLMLLYYLKKIQKCFSRHEKLPAHGNTVLLKTNAHIEDALSKSDKKTTEKKKRSNELYIGKLIKAVHFLATNNLPVKELYPKLVRFLQMILKSQLLIST